MEKTKRTVVEKKKKTSYYETLKYHRQYSFAESTTDKC